MTQACLAVALAADVSGLHCMHKIPASSLCSTAFQRCYSPSLKLDAAVHEGLTVALRVMRAP